LSSTRIKYIHLKKQNNKRICLGT